MAEGLEAGQKVILVEDGSRTEVEIIQDRCNLEREAYQVRVIRILCNRDDGGNAITPEDEGVKILDIFQVRGLNMWTLELQN